MGVPGYLPREESFLFHRRSRRLGSEGVVPHSVVGPFSFFVYETGKRRGRTTQRGRSPVIPHALVHMRMNMVPLSGQILESGAGHCKPVFGGLSLP